MFFPIAVSAQTSIYCSCVRTLNSFLPSVPLIDAIYFQSFVRTTPQVGGVALFSFGEGVWKQHVAYIAYMDEDGILFYHGNRSTCALTKQWMRWDQPDPALVGFLRM